MRHLIQDELKRLKPSWKSSPLTTLGARVMGFMSQLLGSQLLIRMIQRVLDRRRYSAWSAQVADRNPALWRELVEHEISQAQYLQSRRGT